MNLNRSLVVGLAVIGMFSGAALAQSAGSAGANGYLRSTGNPKRDTLLRMSKPVTVEFRQQRLEDVMTFLAEITGADIESLWVDDQHSTGMDKERAITLKSDGASALDLLEKVLEKGSDDGLGPSGLTWQLSGTGALQVGPRDRLNKYKRVEMYDISDLLLVLPTYSNAPEFDLQSVLQSGRGGGSGSPFTNTQNVRREVVPLEQRARDVIDLMIGLIEPEQWMDNGGDGGSIRYYTGVLIVNAPDYMHRQINGYSFWPSHTASAGTSGRRYVSLNMDAATSVLDSLVPRPVTAVVPPGGGK